MLNIFFDFCKYFYVTQLTSALRYIHAAGLACRTLDPTKILVLGKHRLLVNCGGIFDVLTFDPNSSNLMAAMAVYQQVRGQICLTATKIFFGAGGPVAWVNPVPED